MSRSLRIMTFFFLDFGSPKVHEQLWVVGVHVLPVPSLAPLLTSRERVWPGASESGPPWPEAMPVRKGGLLAASRQQASLARDPDTDCAVCKYLVPVSPPKSSTASQSPCSMVGCLIMGCLLFAWSR